MYSVGVCIVCILSCTALTGGVALSCPRHRRQLDRNCRGRPGALKHDVIGVWRHGPLRASSVMSHCETIDGHPALLCKFSSVHEVLLQKWRPDFSEVGKTHAGTRPPVSDSQLHMSFHTIPDVCLKSDQLRTHAWRLLRCNSANARVRGYTTRLRDLPTVYCPIAITSVRQHGGHTQRTVTSFTARCKQLRFHQLLPHTKHSGPLALVYSFNGQHGTCHKDI